jgi:YbbR domain-containing protein
VNRPPPLSWIVTNWRLKLLSLVLAAGLLGGVAFSQNPPTLVTVPVRVEYRNLPKDLVVVDPPANVDVRVVGFRDDVQRYQQSAAGVSVDLSRAQPGAAVRFQPQAGLNVGGLTFPQGIAPISLTIEPVMTRLLDIEVLTKNKSAGIATVPEKTYATCGNGTDRCQVQVTGPVSVVSNLSAYVDYDVFINSAATGNSPNQPIKFDLRGRPIDLNHSPRTLPQIQWTPGTVSVLVTTEGGTQTKIALVLVRIQGAQACGFQVTGVDVQPSQVTVTGPADAVGKMPGVNVDPVVISGLNSPLRVQRTVQTGSALVIAEPAQVTVAVGVVQEFPCAAPTATPAPPSPSPGPHPT